MQTLEMGVAEITMRLISVIETDEIFQNVMVRGEVSNFKFSGPHAYFSLKEGEYLLNCVMFNATYRHPSGIKDGTVVKASGAIKVYPKRGTYQLYTESILEGKDYGELYKRFEELKIKLKNEGIFDKPKKEIPRFPQKIAVVSSKTSAAFHDVVKTIKKRYPLAVILLFHTSVQGKEASKEIVSALDAADRSSADVILLVRGGGSIEDLWNFNEEIVVKKVYAMKTPVITGVGHEVDTTLVDYVADRRSPTPTGAAEYATPDLVELKRNIDISFSRITNEMDQKIDESFDLVERSKKRLDFLSPKRQISIETERINESFSKMIKIVDEMIKEKRSSLIRNFEAISHSKIVRTIELVPERLDSKMEMMKRTVSNDISKKYLSLEKIEMSLNVHDPLEPVRRGYAMVFKDERLVKSVHELKKSDEIKLKLSDGKILSEVVEIEENGK
ncbi:MAG: exodeoxyribonuclease VII large subunit [Athalassotoga sp.]|uniref:exodeoxyribonuclease VII large subunit n=1 Tax=Athalassotoga sp. TaxID=2022597 RepID=UPI003D0855EF